MAGYFVELKILKRCQNIPGTVVSVARRNKQKPGTSIFNLDDGTKIEDIDQVVLKRYNLEQSEDIDDFIEITDYIGNEASLMRQFKHPNVLPCLASYVSGSEVILVTPKMYWGSLKDLVETHFNHNEGIPELAVALIFKQVILALQYLHAKAIVHRSVRASHILISESGEAKLSGLRYACSLLHPAHGTVQDRYDYPLHVVKTNMNWLSPEFLQQNLLGYNELTDIYSLGVTACECANGIVPFSDYPSTLMLLEKLRGSAPKLLDSNTFHEVQQLQAEASSSMQFPSDVAADSGVGASVGSCYNMTSNKSAMFSNRTFSDNFHSFVEDCTSLEPDNRPSALELLSRPFIKQLKKTNTTLSSILEPYRTTESPIRAVSPPSASVEEEMEGLQLHEPWDFDEVKPN